MQKLTRENQPFRDRLQRAQSWLERVRAIVDDPEGWQDHDAQFVFYWIALNALYSQNKEDYRSDSKDLNAFIVRICNLDRHDEIRTAILSVKKKADDLLRDKFLCEMYWEEGTTSRVEKVLKMDYQTAQEAWDKGHLETYLRFLFRRIRMLRNQIFHGCSTDRRSLNRTSLMPAVAILQILVPVLAHVFENNGEKESWPPVAYPRNKSPLNPDSYRKS